MPMTNFLDVFRRNRTQSITLASLCVFFLLAAQGMETGDWMVTILRGLAVAAVTFLVASGFSLIFGLMDVLNLAHGTMFMIGAYLGWTVYVRPDTFIDLLPPLGFIASGLVLVPLFEYWLTRVNLPHSISHTLPWVVLVLGLILLYVCVLRFPIAMWDANVYEKSPIIYSVQLDQNKLTLPDSVPVDVNTLFATVIGTLMGGAFIALALAAFARQHTHRHARFPMMSVIIAGSLLVIGLVALVLSNAFTQSLLAMDTNARFFIAVIAATLGGAGIGALMETSLIRPLYARPIYQLMLTLGLGVIGREVVVAVWGRSQITMPKPALFNGTGKGCPAVGISDWLTNQCATISFMDTRIRTYNEIFIILVGIFVLIAVWLLLQRSRIGMVIRAGVQDREMVEALGTNVRRVFTFVFALGVGLASLGGVLAGPFMGVSDGMGESLLLSALIALAIGGLTSFPGAAAGSVLVGLVQQFIVKYGQIGIQLPFLTEPFKPSPPLVPASTVLLMVIVLLVMPQGLFGRKE